MISLMSLFFNDVLWIACFSSCNPSIYLSGDRRVPLLWDFYLFGSGFDFYSIF